MTAIKHFHAATLPTVQKRLPLIEAYSDLARSLGSEHVGGWGSPAFPVKLTRAEALRSPQVLISEKFMF